MRSPALYRSSMGSRTFSAGDGGVELGLEVQVAAVVALLGGGHGHRPHPVAQDQGVMQDVGHDAPPGELGLGLVHLGVILDRVDSALAPHLGGHLFL